ncbi:MAG TPA: thioredoxin family protein [Tepidisphaeraceae bacterium]
MRTILIGALVPLLLLVGMSVFVQADESKAKAALGTTAPAFVLKDQDGNDVSLADFKGKVVVLEWFNNECPFVQKHYTGGAMNAVASKYAAKGVTWLAINTTGTASIKSNREIATEWKIDRPILDDNSGVVGRQYGATNTPQMFVIDAAGKIVYRGAIDDNDSKDAAGVSSAKNHVATALDDVLAGKAVSRPETKAYGCTVKYK